MKLQAEQVEVQGKRFVDGADMQVFLIIRSYSKLSVKSILTFRNHILCYGTTNLGLWSPEDGSTPLSLCDREKALNMHSGKCLYGGCVHVN